MNLQLILAFLLLIIPLVIRLFRKFHKLRSLIIKWPSKTNLTDAVSSFHWPCTHRRAQFACLHHNIRKELSGFCDELSEEVSPVN